MTDNTPPMYFIWDGESHFPERPRLADKYYVVGARYRLVPEEERSMRSHRFYFASINEAFANLPEDLAERFPTSEHLRKFALIKSGFRDERSFVAASKAEAVSLSTFIKPIDDYAWVVVSEATVTVYTAKSQSVRAMGKRVFQDSKDKVLDVVSAMIGTSAETLRQNAEQAA